MTKSDNDQSVNFTRRSAKRIAKVVRTVERIPDDLRRGKRGHKSAREGIVIKPPWWPAEVSTNPENLRVAPLPATVQNLWVEYASGTAVLGTKDAYLSITGGSSGYFAVKCEYAADAERIDTATIEVHEDTIPADVVDSYFYIATHVFYTTPLLSPATGHRLFVRPLYFGSLMPIRYGDYWRW